MTNVGDRLQVLYEVSRRLTSFTDLKDLQRYVTRRAQELFQAEGCAVMLHDRARRELYFLPVASQVGTQRAVEEQLAELRFPADRGIAGWVLAHGEAALVPDTSVDPRFYTGIDQRTHMATRSVLCAPLRVGSEVIGVISVVNPAREALNAEDLTFLEALAADVALAHEKVLLYERLRGEVLGLRQAARMGGGGLLVLGLVVLGGVVLAHLASALPLGWLPGRPAFWFASGAVALGAVLVAVGRGHLIRTPPS